MPRLRPLASRGALALALALLAPAAYAGIDVSPLLVDLSRERPSSTVVVRNGGDRPLRLEVRAFTWAQDARGEMELAPTGEVVVFPPLLELAPGASRSIRVGTKLKPGADERSYRIFLEQLPPPQEPGQPAQIALLTRIGLPVFLSPARPAPRPEITAASVAGGQVSFSLRNAGNARFRALSVELAAVDALGARLAEHELPAWYVLARGERHYTVSLPPDLCAQARAVSVTARLDVGEVTARLPLDAAACVR